MESNLQSSGNSQGGGNYQLNADEFKTVDITSSSIQAFYVAVRLTEAQDMTIRTSTNATVVSSVAYSDSSVEIYSGTSTPQVFVPSATAADFVGEIIYSLC